MCSPKCSLPILRVSLLLLLHLRDVELPQEFSACLYGDYKSYGINFDTLDKILLDPFLIIFEIVVTINTPVGERGSVVLKHYSTRLNVAGSRHLQM
jgi:hypothetical protein